MRIVTLIVAALVAVQPAVALASPQREIASAQEREAWRDVAQAIPPGSTVRVELSGGRRITGTLMSVTGDTLVIKKQTRVAEPAVAVPIAGVTRLERVEKSRTSVAKLIGVGVASGAGAFLAFLAFALMLSD